MKVRILRKLLNSPGYSITYYRDYISVGSSLCHDLIKVDLKTLKITYALDTFKQGRRSLEKDGKSQLLFIWDKLQDLIDSGEIN